MKQIFILFAVFCLIGSACGLGITTSLDRTVSAKPGVVFFVGNASANQTFTLPDAATANLKGFPFEFVVNTDPGSYYFRLTATGGDDIGGNNYYVITEPGALKVTSDGTDYHVQSHEGTWVASAA